MNEYYVLRPLPNDVLAGRGNGSNQHPGNVLFRTLVAVQRDAYLDSGTSKQDKQVIVSQVINKIESQNPPGRFLTKCKRGVWCRMEEKETKRKTAQALREREKSKDIQPMSVAAPPILPASTTQEATEIQPMSVVSPPILYGVTTHAATEPLGIYNSDHDRSINLIDIMKDNNESTGLGQSSTSNVFMKSKSTGMDIVEPLDFYDSSNDKVSWTYKICRV